MPRYAFLIEYDGAAFSGWQRQPDRPSVQGAIEAALEKLKPRADGMPHKITGAGRTDAGVHATGQVAHFDLDDDWDTFRVSEAVNYHLKPARIGILTCARVADDWHARFGAVQRKYVFRLMSRRAPLTSERASFGM